MCRSSLPFVKMATSATASSPVVRPGDICIGQDGDRGLFAVVAAMLVKAVGQFKCWIRACEMTDYGEMVKKQILIWLAWLGREITAAS